MTGTGAPLPPLEAPWPIAGACVLALRATGGAGDRAWLERFASALRQAGFPLAAVVPDPADIKPGGPGMDLLLVEAGIEMDPADALELRRAAAGDPMIAGVSPRRAAAGADAAWRRLLPAVAYAPLGDGACLYLKGSVLREFRGPARGAPADWDAYAFEVNAAGFRMALANRASYRAPPLPPRAEAASLVARGRRLDVAFPGAAAALRAFLSGAPQAAERVIAGLAPDDKGRRTVAFDLTHVGTKPSGTAEAALALVRRAALAWRRDWVVAVMADAASYAFHFGEGAGAPRRIDPSDPAPCAAFIRIGQPFGWKEVEAAVRRAPALVFFMLDTIGLDCMRLAPDDLDALWRFTLAEADGLLFNSAFTRRQYERRFGLRVGQPRLVSLHSLDTRDYRRGEPPAGAGGDGTLLVIGNGFAHKRVAQTARLLARACPGRPIAAVGIEPGGIAGVAGHPSGSLDPAAMAALYGRASLVVYPSLYEGFGFPVLEALAHRRPVLVRALPPFAEIAAGTPEAANIHVFRDEGDLVALVAAAPRWTEARGDLAARDWDDALADLRRVLDDALAALDHDRILRRIDFLRGRLAFVRHKPFARDVESDDALDRLSAHVGRLAAKAVRHLAALPGGRAALRRLARRRGGC